MLYSCKNVQCIFSSCRWCMASKYPLAQGWKTWSKWTMRIPWFSSMLNFSKFLLMLLWHFDFWDAYQWATNALCLQVMHHKFYTISFLNLRLFMLDLLSLTFNFIFTWRWTPKHEMHIGSNFWRFIMNTSKIL